MTTPMGLAASLTGLPSGKRGKRKGPKGNGRPGSEHLAALQKAHGAGDFKTAKTHALNYAKAVHKNAEPDADETPASPPVGFTAMPSPSAPPDGRRAQLAKLVMGRKK